MFPTFCKKTSKVLAQAAEEVIDKSTGNSKEKMWSPSGTVVTIEGPRFSTRAESLLFKSWNCDVINMTTGNSEQTIDYTSFVIITKLRANM